MAAEAVCPGKGIISKFPDYMPTMTERIYYHLQMKKLRVSWLWTPSQAEGDWHPQVPGLDVRGNDGADT